MKRTIVFIFVLAALLTGCKKYVEGPGFSLRSKQARIVGGWVTDKHFTNDVEDADADQYQQEMEFDKDGRYTYSFTNPYFSTVTTFKGTWEFRDDKNELLLGLNRGYQGEMQYETWDIIMLKNDEIRLEMEYGDLYEWWLKAK